MTNFQGRLWLSVSSCIYKYLSICKTNAINNIYACECEVNVFIQMIMSKAHKQSYRVMCLDKHFVLPNSLQISPLQSPKNMIKHKLSN